MEICLNRQYKTGTGFIIPREVLGKKIRCDILTDNGNNGFTLETTWITTGDFKSLFGLRKNAKLVIK